MRLEGRGGLGVVGMSTSICCMRRGHRSKSAGIWAATTRSSTTVVSALVPAKAHPALSRIGLG